MRVTTWIPCLKYVGREMSNLWYIKCYVLCPYCQEKVEAVPLFHASETSSPPIKGFSIKEHICDKLCREKNP